MFKKYNKIENYFVDKEQLERYKNDKLIPFEKIFLTNNNHMSDLKINIDKFRNAILIFQNSCFKNLSIYSFNIIPKSNINFNNCKIYTGKINLNPYSEVNISECEIHNLNVEAQKIYIYDIKYLFDKNFGSHYFKLKLGNENTEIINIHNTQPHSRYSEFLINSKKLYVDKSNIKLNTDCDIIHFNNSDINITKLIASKNILLTNCHLNKFDMFCSEKIKFIKCPTIFIAGKNKIENCLVETERLCVKNDSNFLSNNTSFDIKDKLILGKNSSLESIENKDSVLNVDNFYLDDNANLNMSNIKFRNSKGKCNINTKEFYDERRKLVKTLKLIVNKYNMPIGKYDGR